MAWKYDDWLSVDTDELTAAYDQWVERIAATHGGSNHRVNPETAFVPLSRPLSECRMALVSTAGVHLGSQAPFHVETIAGDASYRLIPDDAEIDDLVFTHTHYDTSSAEQDPNVVLPIEPLRRAVEAGRVGSASAIHVGMMGFNPNPVEIAEVSGPAVAEELGRHEVDVVMLVPG